MARPEGGRGKRGAQRVGELVPRVLDEMGLGSTSNAVKLCRIWDAALGNDLAPHCRPDGIRRGVIQARVRDSAWMQRIQLQKPGILARIEAAMGDSVARDLRLRVGPVDPPGGERS